MNSIQPQPGPSAITAQWIASQSKPFEGVELYFERLYFDAGDHNAQRNMLATMPRGYRMLFVFWRFYTDVDNGGFGQFIGNASAEDPSQEIIVETVEALSRLGMDELASLCKEAIAVLVDELPPVVLTVLPESTRQRVAHRHLSEAETRVELYRLDEMYNEMMFSFVSKFDKYITAHPEEFVHPVNEKRG